MTVLSARPAATRARDPRHRTGNAPPWTRFAALGLLVVTAVLYFWNLTASGYGNSFYAAAVQSGTQNLQAWLFGSLDPGNVITVDKPPAALWVTTAFARVFGFSSFTVLAPQALMGVASVGLLYLTVRRVSGPLPGLLAGAGLALTPVAALMFRFNNPDALLVLLLVAAAYCTVRAIENASPKWLVFAGTAIGFGFLTKMMQAFLVLPAFALAYLVAAPATLGKRLLHLLSAAGAVLVSAGWFVALVELWPTASRPYIGGSTGDSLLELALGYNGLGRIFGGDGNGGPGGGPGGGGGGGNAMFGGDSGLGRMFGASFGTEVSWLLPAALLGLAAGLWFTRRAARTDRTRAALVVWGGWLLVTAVVFSFMGGTIHPYYAVQLAPAIAAVVAISGHALWRGRAYLAPRILLGAMIAVTAVWDFILLDRTPDWLPALRWVIVVLGLVAATFVVVGLPRLRTLIAGLAVATVVTLGAGTAAYGVETVSVPHSGSIPTSGPQTSGAGGMGGFGGGGPGMERDSAALGQLLARTTTKWAAATTSSQSAASLELASGKGVIGIGGWMGSDPAPTLAEFRQYVAAGEVSYYVDGGRGGGPGGGSSEIGDWVAANFTATTVDGQTVYRLVY
ncbi:ArnT family glycosyltransferase [Amycolatopsis jiangsuensis]|uniref:4-amino-4-deoxy-L-arabinose transferase-like glycosyltransferase n=1 Tax=Amycolatopsis jiangsuensis TaxID=1181879 RepID=A0A840J8N3_9PSEU|nr:glycosyltransferase family 39 protein [Amycolatopsis jiangsuensis]MBB4689727.1 4-amino-4-deoxy-L-arabinose transferase-like glycosyltransferase [Amycolatopsis jiangsuensis]